MAHETRDHHEMTFEPTRAGRALRFAVRLCILAALVWGAHLLSSWVSVGLKSLPPGESSLMLNSVLVLILLGYAILIALPFVPGVEVGLSLIMLEGPPVVPFVYAASVLGLSLAYLSGRFMPPRWIRRLLSDLHLKRAAALFERVEPLPAAERLSLLYERLPGWLGRRILHWRYAVLAVLVNLPGTMIIGGGGGIAMVAGLSRLFTPTATIVTFLIAVSPVPLGIWFFGIGLLHSG